MKIIQTKDKLNPTHGLACTSRMRTTRAVVTMDTCFALIGAESLFNTIGKNKSLTKNFSLSFRYITHTDCQLSFNGHLKRLTHPLQGQLEGLSNQLISLYKAYKTARLSIFRLRDNLLYITYTTTTTSFIRKTITKY